MHGGETAPLLWVAEWLMTVDLGLLQVASLLGISGLGCHVPKARPYEGWGVLGLVGVVGGKREENVGRMGIGLDFFVFLQSENQSIDYGLI